MDEEDNLPANESEARAVIADLAGTINDFRDGQRWGLVTR